MDKQDQIIEQLKILNNSMIKLLEVNNNLFRLFNQYNSEYHETMKGEVRFEDS